MAYAACGFDIAIVASFLISSTIDSTLLDTKSRMKDFDPTAAPKCLPPCAVTWMPVCQKSFLACSSLSGLTINRVLLGFG